MRRSTRISGRSEGAFTLVEILVAMTVLSIIMAMLFSIFDHTTKAWQASEKSVDSYREARAALYMIKRDFGTLFARSNIPIVLNHAGTGTVGVSGELAPAGIADNVLFQSLQSMRAQDSGNMSDLCATGYYVAWSKNQAFTNQSSSINESFNLFRYFNDSRTNYTNLGLFFNQMAADPTHPDAALHLLFTNLQATGGFNTGNEVVARNVTSFRVKPYWMDEAGTLVTVAATGAATLTKTPAFFELELKVINYSTATQLRGLQTNWTLASADAPSRNLLQRSERVFCTRITLPKPTILPVGGTP